jgi:O-antigen biosynthesis protein WbqP
MLDDGMPIFFKQKRVGKLNSIFMMYKFRTMKKDTPDVATHLLKDPDKYILKIGKIIRRFSLDEVPNLINILKGDMNFVGPRPALYNQDDLIELRTKSNVHTLAPGLTGWAQINGRDEISIPAKVVLDTYYLKNKSFLFDLKIMYLTLIKTIKSEGVSH